MMEVKITKKTDQIALILWEEDGEFGNIQIVYNGKGGFDCNSEYIGMDRFLRIMGNLPDKW